MSKKKNNIVEEILRKQKLRSRQHGILLSKIKKNHAQLKKLLDSVSSHWGYEDPIYRYYHTSLKVFFLQGTTEKIYKALLSIRPNKLPLDKDFMEIYNAGCPKIEFKLEYNSQWSKTCIPFLEAFFHAKFFLEMAVKYGKELKKAPNILPSGWAALLHLYNIR